VMKISILRKLKMKEKKRDVDDKKPGESDNEVSSPRSPRTEKDEIPKTDDVKESPPPPKFNHEKQNRSDSNRSDSNRSDSNRSDSNRRDPQKRDDKFKRNNNNRNPENKPFVRGSKSQDKGGFKKEDRNTGRDRPRKDEKREERPRVEKVKEHIEIKVDVTSKNLFSALTEDEE